MTKDQKIIRAKAGVLELAKQLGNVSQACKIMGYSRDSFYRFKDLYDKGGEAGASGDVAAQADPEEPGAAGDRGRRWWPWRSTQPAWGQARVSNELAQAGDVGLALRRALGLAAPRPADHETAAQGAGGEDAPRTA